MRISGEGRRERERDRARPPLPRPARHAQPPRPVPAQKRVFADGDDFLPPPPPLSSSTWFKKMGSGSCITATDRSLARLTSPARRKDTRHAREVEVAVSWSHPRKRPLCLFPCARREQLGMRPPLPSLTTCQPRPNLASERARGIFKARMDGGRGRLSNQPTHCRGHLTAMEKETPTGRHQSRFLRASRPFAARIRGFPVRRRMRSPAATEDGTRALCQAPGPSMPRETGIGSEGGKEGRNDHDGRRR